MTVRCCSLASPSTAVDLLGVLFFGLPQPELNPHGNRGRLELFSDSLSTYLLCEGACPSVGHPPPGDFIALGSKGQTTESKTASTLLKPAASGLPSERKRDAAAALAGASALPGLTKRPKLSSTPPLSALGRLAEAAVAEKRAISPSIKEPSVVPIEGKHSLWTSPRKHSPCLVPAPGFRKATSRLSTGGSGEWRIGVSCEFVFQSIS